MSVVYQGAGLDVDKGRMRNKFCYEFYHWKGKENDKRRIDVPAIQGKITI